MNLSKMDLAISVFESSTRVKVYSIRPLEMDPAEENYLINLQFRLRIKNGYDIDSRFFQNKVEYEIIRDLTASKDNLLLPQTLMFDPTNGMMLSKYLEDGFNSGVRNGNFLRYLSLIESIKRLHEIEAEYGFFNPLLLFNSFKDILGEEFQKGYEEDVLRRASSAFSRSPLALCHNKLDPFSFAYDSNRKMTRFLDFKYAGTGFEIVDIASLLSENDIDPRLEERLINAYYGIANVTKEKVDDVHAAMELLDMVWYFFYSIRYKESLEEPFFLLAKKKMGRIRKSIKNFISK